MYRQLAAASYLSAVDGADPGTGRLAQPSRLQVAG